MSNTNNSEFAITISKCDTLIMTYTHSSAIVPAPVCESAMSANGIITVSWSFTHTGGVPLTNLSVFYTFSEGLNQVNGTERYVDIVATSVMVPGLQAGTEYTFSVIAVNSEGSAVSVCAAEVHREGAFVIHTLHSHYV